MYLSHLKTFSKKNKKILIISTIIISILLFSIVSLSIVNTMAIEQLKERENQENGWEQIVYGIEKCPYPLCELMLEDYKKQAQEQIQLAKDYIKVFETFWKERDAGNAKQDSIYKERGQFTFYFWGRKNCKLIERNEKYARDYDKESKNYETIIAEILDKMEIIKNKMKSRNKEQVEKILIAFREYESLIKKYNMLTSGYNWSFAELLKNECDGFNIKDNYNNLQVSSTPSINDVSSSFSIAREKAIKMTREFKKMNNL